MIQSLQSCFISVHHAIYTVPHSRWLCFYLLLHTGLGFALDLLKPVKEQFPDVSYADIFQMASATAIEVGHQ